MIEVIFFLFVQMISYNSKHSIEEISLNVCDEMDLVKYPLSVEDLLIEKIGLLDSPALSSGLHESVSWANYNRWRCYPPHSIDLNYSHVEYNGWKKWPSLQVHTAGKILLFEPEVDQELPLESAFKIWEYLKNSNSSICIFAAHLQRLDEIRNLFVVDRIKTARGTWVARNWECSGLSDDCGEAPTF